MISIDRKVIPLTAAQACAVLAAMGHATFTGLAGKQLASNPMFATVPLTLMVIGTLLSVIPMSMFMRRTGRRAGFLVASGAGIMSGVIGATAIYQHSFVLLILAGMCQGLYQAGIQYYRFAAMELVEPQRRGRAVATVLGGGIIGALLGPWLFTSANAAFAPVTFMGAYIALAVIAVIAASILLTAYRSPPTSQTVMPGDHPSARPLPVILKQAGVICAVVNAMAAFALMTLTMTAAPLHIVDCGFSIDLAAQAIQWHILAMFIPSFFISGLIERFGLTNILLCGAALFAATGVTGLLGIELHHFRISLIFSGIGWNFLFTAGTALLAEHYLPEERSKVQGFNEFLIFGSAALTSLSAGVLLALSGWAAVNTTVIVVAAIVFGTTLWYKYQSFKSHIA